MTIYYIYRATNKINGKSYIGYTSNFERRKKSHKREAIYKPNKNSLFHKAIRKYGFDSFEWDILFESEDKVYTHKVMEPYFISLHNTFLGEGYNLSPGGEGNTSPRSEQSKQEHSLRMKGRKHSDNHKKKRSESLKGRKFSEEHKRKLSLAKMGNKSCVGRMVSDETRLKISQSKRKD
jgi:group I intron endonuclease